MNLDDLFGEGVEFANDYLVKAHLKLNIKPSQLPAAQGIIEQLEAAYDERLTLLLADLMSIIKTADARKSLGLYVINGGLSNDLMKAVFVDDVFTKSDGLPNIPGKPPAAPAAPTGPAPTTLSGKPYGKKGQGPQAERKEMDQMRAGKRGGKWYLTKTGKVRYGTKPQEHDEREATPEEIGEHIKHFRPGPFMGLADGDQVLVGHLVEHAEELGFSEHEAGFLRYWYGEKNDKGVYVGGDGFDAFLDTFFPAPQGKNAKKRQRENALKVLSGDLSQVKLSCSDLGLKDVSFQEAVVALMSIQNFYGDEKLSKEDMDQLFEEKVKPILDDMFQRYEDLKTNPAVHEKMKALAEQVEKDTYHFYVQAHDCADKVKGWSEAITASAGDPTHQVTHSLAAMSAMNLFIIPTAKDKAKAKHLKGVIVPNNAIFGQDALLQNDPERLRGLNTDQLMLVYMATQLHGMFDPDTRTYEHLSGHHDTKLSEHILDILKDKIGLDDATTEMVVQKMDEAASLLGDRLTQANTGKDVLLKLTVMNADSYLKDPEAAAKLQKKIEELNKLRTDALAAQSDDNFELPKSMAEGRLGAVHKGDKPHDHQKIRDKDGNVIIDPETGKEKTFGLFKHQRQAINWMMTAKRGLLALDAGMGKTPTVITFCEHLREQGQLKEGEQVQLFLPPSVINQWPKEIETYAPGLKKEDILSLGGMSLDERKRVLSSDVAKKAKYILISTGTLSGGTKEEKDAKKTQGPKYDENGELLDDGTGGTDDELTEMLKSIKGPVFIDEVHTGGFKDEGTVRHKVAKAVMADREHAFGMTATPMPNGPMDLFHLTNLFAPGIVGTKDEWEGSTSSVHYDGETNKFVLGNPQALMEVRDRVRPFVMHKMITDPEVVKDIGSQLGDKHEDPDLGPIQPEDDHPWYEHTKPGGKIDLLHEVLFQNIVKKAKAKDRENNEHKNAQGEEIVGPAEQRIWDSAGYLRGGLRDGLMRQACISPELYDKSYKQHNGLPGGGSPKIARMVDDIVKHFKGGGGTQDKPCVIFSSLPGKAFALVKRELVKAGFDPDQIGEIHGGKSSRERAFEQDMTNAGKRKILLVGTKSGGAGLNLQKKANRVFYLDSPADPASKRQAVGRVWRPGQQDTVTESNLMMASQYGLTWDEKNSNYLSAKQFLVSGMLSNTDLESTDFTIKASEHIKQIGAAATAKPQQAKIKITPEIEKLASEIDIDELLKDPSEDDPGQPQKLSDFFDMAKHKELTSEAKGLAQKTDIKEEKRVWDRSYDMDAMPSKWRLEEVLASTASTPEAKAASRDRIIKLAKTSAGWFNQICTEAAAAEKSGDKAKAKELTKQAEKFQQSLPAIKMSDIESFVTEMQGATKQVASATGPKHTAQPKLGTDKAPAGAKPKATATKPAAKTPAAKAPAKAEAKKPAAKEEKSFSVSAISPFSAKKTPDAHRWYTALLQAKPKDLAAAHKVMEKQLKAEGNYDEEDIPEVAKQVIQYMQKHKALG